VRIKLRYQPLEFDFSLSIRPVGNGVIAPSGFNGLTSVAFERRCRAWSSAKQSVQQNHSPHRGQKRTSVSLRPHSRQRLTVDIKAPVKESMRPMTFSYAKITCKHCADRLACDYERVWSALLVSSHILRVRAITIETKSITNPPPLAVRIEKALPFRA
jgi:hypothetical protein